MSGLAPMDSSKKGVDSRKDFNLLDRAVLGLALLKTDMDFRDKWAIWYGKGIISISIATHILLFYRDILGYAAPSRLMATILGFMIATLCYAPVHLASHPAKAFQKIDHLSTRERWTNRVWGLIVGPVGWLAWIPVWIFFP